MAKKAGQRSSGLLILEILIAVLIIVLIIAILTPKSQWKEQAREEAVCRQRMENIHFASKFYHRVTGSYTDDLQELLTFAERESIRVHPPGFKMDRLTREDSGIDSFQVDYFDPYQLFSHYEKAIDINYATADSDSVVLTIVPKKQYPFAPVTKYFFTSDVHITAVTDDRGDQGIFTMVGAQGRLHGTQILGDKTSVPADQYIYSIERDDLDNCPTTRSRYKLWVTVKLTIEAVMTATLHETPPETSLSSSQRLASIVIYRMLKKAHAKANRTLLNLKMFETVEDSLIQASNLAFLDSTRDSLRAEGLGTLAGVIYDSTLDEHVLSDQAQVMRWEEVRDASYEYMNKLKEDSSFQSMRDGIVNDRKTILVIENFRAQLEHLRKEASLRVLETGFINTTADSIDFYSNSELIKDRLFKGRKDKITLEKLSHPDVADLLSRFSFLEIYSVNKLDSTGINISCPIEDEYRKPDLSLLKRIFMVKGAENHGIVERGDLSWSEKR